MKKTILFATFFLLLSMASAQIKVRPGIKMGINNSTITNSYLDFKMGIYAGAFASIRFSDLYTMQPELMYSNQGGKSGVRSTKGLNIQYLSIGLANKFFLSPNIGLHFVLGPTLDINARNNFVSVVNGNWDLERNPIDVAFFGGIGYEFDFGLILEARYKQGMLDVNLFNDDEAYTPDDDKNRLNAVFQFGVAYKFDF